MKYKKKEIILKRVFIKDIEKCGMLKEDVILRAEFMKLLTTAVVHFS
jgi:hypothetical protein